MNAEFIKAITDLQGYAKPLMDKFTPAMSDANTTPLDPNGCSGCPVCELARTRGVDDPMVAKATSLGLALLRMFGAIPNAETASTASAPSTNGTSS